MAPSRLHAAALAGVSAFTLLATAAPAAAARPPAPAHDEQITFQDWSGPADWHRGDRAG